MIPVREFAVLVFALASGWAPNAEPTEMTQIDVRIDTVPLLTIGDKPEDPLYQTVGAAFVGDELVLAEISSGTLRYYDQETGELVRTAGGTGEGPGEHRMLSFFQGDGEWLYTYDFALMRLTVFDGSGEVEKTVGIRPWEGRGHPLVRGVFPDGSLLVASSVQNRGAIESPTVERVRWTLARYDSLGNFVDSLGHYLSSESLWVPFGSGGGASGRWTGPFQRSAAAGVLDDGYTVLDNMNASISVFDQMGRPIQELGSEVRPEPRALTAEDRGAFLEMGRIAGWELPEFYPYHVSIRELNSLFWVMHYHDPRTAGSSWTLYSRDGDRVGRVTASERLVVLAADDDIVAVQRVDELGVETVELRRLVGWPRP